MKSLISLNLKCNKLSTITSGSIVPLVSLPKLSYLYLEGNLPLCEDEMWIFQAFEQFIVANSDRHPNNELHIDGVSILDVFPDLNKSNRKALPPSEPLLSTSNSEQHYQKLLMDKLKEEANMHLVVKKQVEKNLIQEMQQHQSMMRECNKKVFDRDVMIDELERSLKERNQFHMELFQHISTQIDKSIHCLLYEIQFTKVSFKNVYLVRFDLI